MNPLIPRQTQLLLTTSLGQLNDPLANGSFIASEIALFDKDTFVRHQQQIADQKENNFMTLFRDLTQPSIGDREARALIALPERVVDSQWASRMHGLQDPGDEIKKTVDLGEAIGNMEAASVTVDPSDLVSASWGLYEALGIGLNDISKGADIGNGCTRIETSWGVVIRYPNGNLLCYDYDDKGRLSSRPESLPGPESLFEQTKRRQVFQAMHELFNVLGTLAERDSCSLEEFVLKEAANIGVSLSSWDDLKSIEPQHESTFILRLIAIAEERLDPYNLGRLQPHNKILRDHFTVT